MGSTTKWHQFSPFNLKRTQRRPAAGKTYPLKMKPMSSPPPPHYHLVSLSFIVIQAFLSLSLSLCIEYFYFLRLKVSDGAANQIRFSHAGY